MLHDGLHGNRLQVCVFITTYSCFYCCSGKRKGKGKIGVHLFRVRTGHVLERDGRKKLRLVLQYWLAYYIVSGTWSGTIYGMTRRRFALYNARATPYHATACFTLHFQRISLFITRRILVLTCVASIFLTQLFVNVIFARYTMLRWQRRRR